MGYNNDASATQQDLYTTIRRGQLFSQSNRLNAGWARGKYLIASYDDTPYSVQEYVDQWKTKVSQYKNQYLCLEIDRDNWSFFDYSGAEIQFIVNPPQLEITRKPVTDIISITSTDKHQQIFYGAPGTGKSHSIKDDIGVKKADEKNLVFRTTFHPDSDYSTFVGCYKPKSEKVDALSRDKLHELYPEFKLKARNRPVFRFISKYNNSFRLLTEKEAESIFDKYETSDTISTEVPKIMAAIEELPASSTIIYSFVPQAFTDAYVAAWRTTEDVYLIIEEINRGNCAQIFGDLFQLLDRKNGISEYPVDADSDLADYIQSALSDSTRTDFPKGVKEGKKLVLPSNLYIWATMNTSDQSLFPIDSAFKRRWDWEYLPIGYKNKWTIEIGEKKYNWVDFQQKINNLIFGVDNSEDKQLGDYFVNADRTGGVISADTLLNKILFYLWNDVCKDDPDQIFRWMDGGREKSIKFSEFFDADRDRKLQGFMEFLKVPAIGEPAETEKPEVEEETDGSEEEEITGEEVTM